MEHHSAASPGYFRCSKALTRRFEAKLHGARDGVNLAFGIHT